MDHPADTRTLARKVADLASGLAGPERETLAAAARRLVEQQDALDRWAATSECRTWDIRPDGPYRVVAVGPEEYAATEFAFDASTPQSERHGGWVEDGDCVDGQHYLLVCVDEEAHRAEMSRRHAADDGHDDCAPRP